MRLTFDHLREVSSRRVLRWHKGGLDEWSLSDWAVAMMGEAGEACDVIKKLNRARDCAPGNKRTPAELQQDLADELADTLIYLDLLAAKAGIDLGEAVISKFNMVSERMGFPERLQL